MAMPMQEPQQAQAPEGAEPPKPGKSPAELVSGIHEGLAELQGMLAQAGQEEEAAGLAQVMTAYEAIVEALTQAPGTQKAGPQVAPGNVTMEQGGAKGAVPMNPGLRG